MTKSRSDGPMSITAVRVKDEPTNKGEFKYYTDSGIKPGVIAGMRFVCPCGCGGKSSLRFDTVYASGWAWDGNMDKPTVSPSVKQLVCGWHGYLRNGRWESV